MAIRILIMGLPGSGKTTLAKELVPKLNAIWFNADEVRQQFNDWDFSKKGRLRQARRMRNLSDMSLAKYVVVDFVAPLQEMRDIFDAQYVIWVDTIKAGRFKNTNLTFSPPLCYNVRINTQDAEYWSNIIVKDILNG